MPFTVSHAAAVLPLHKFTKGRLPLAALMIGSMAPDFAYFLPAYASRVATHSMAGVFWFCWPVGLAVWLFFVRVLEQPTMTLLPESWRTRIVPSTRTLSLTTLALTSVAIMLGAITHIVWDAFTHDSAVADAIPALSAVAVEVSGRRIHWYWVMQVLSSLFGLAVLAIWAWRLTRPAPSSPPPHSPELLPSVSNKARVGALLLLCGSSGALALVRFSIHPNAGIQPRLFEFLMGGMTGWVLAWCAIAILIGWRSRAVLTAPSSRE